MILQLLTAFGTMINIDKNTKLASILTKEALKNLLLKHHLVVIRGFHPPTKDELVTYAKSIGPLLEWEFGHVMEMCVHEKTKNYLFTHDAVPFHWDGAFHQTPRYLLFHCIEAPVSGSGGETIFSNTSKIWQSTSIEEKLTWSTLELTYKTEKLAHYGGSITVPLVQIHPDTQQTILRFAEPVLPIQLNPVTVTLEGHDAKSSQEFIAKMSKICYEKKYCYIHAWKKNDFLIADNHTLIHGRHAFKQFSPRHLRRIQIL